MAIPSTSKEYFAGGSASECAASLQAKAKSFHSFMGGNAYTDKITKMWRAYHGVYNDESYANHEISFTGEQGELVSLPVNHFRNIAEHIKTMITSSRPTMDARPINTDYKSATQAALASGILDYYMREKHLEDFITKAVEYAIVMGSGYVKMEWNATSGEAFDVDPETGEFAYNGELEFSNPTPMDVVFDGTKESWDHQWVMVRSFKNRYDLMAKYPEMADKIRAVPTKSSTDGYSRALWSNDDTDDIAVMEFFHEQTEALPDGRYLLFCNDDCVLLDTRMPYRQIPVFRISPADYLGTSYGYSNMFDLFPIQQCVNSIYSAIQTNQTAFGVHNIFVQTNANIDVSNLEGAMNVIKGNSKPEVLSLLATPKEMFDFLQVLISAMETISGVNSVARGNPEASLRSGSALALVQSMALQFISGFQQSYVKLVEGSGTGILNILKDFAHTPRIVAIVGKSNKPYVQEFTGDMIKDISRVTVDMGNPLSKTIAGRVQMAEQMMQMKLIKTPTQYFQVLNNGKLENMFEGDVHELLLIRRENEFLLEGKPILANIYDAHRTHIMEHKSLAADPDLRFNATLMTALNAHIQEHIDMLRTVDPDLLQLLGEQPLQPQQVPGMPPPGAGGPPPGPTKDSMGQGMEEMMQPQQGMNQQGDSIADAVGGPQSLPGVPSPPPPFQNSPTDPAKM